MLGASRDLNVACDLLRIASRATQNTAEHHTFGSRWDAWQSKCCGGFEAASTSTGCGDRTLQACPWAAKSAIDLAAKERVSLSEAFHCGPGQEVFAAAQQASRPSGKDSPRSDGNGGMTAEE